MTNTLSSRAAGIVQQANTMHTLISMEKWEEAQKALGTIEAHLQVLNRDLWLQYHNSGEVK